MEVLGVEADRHLGTVVLDRNLIEAFTALGALALEPDLPRVEGDFHPTGALTGGNGHRTKGVGHGQPGSADHPLRSLGDDLLVGRELGVDELDAEVEATQVEEDVGPSLDHGELKGVGVVGLAGLPSRLLAEALELQDPLERDEHRGCVGTLDLELHLAQAMAVGGHHPNALSIALEEGAVQVGPSLVRGDREVRSLDQIGDDAHRDGEPSLCLVEVGKRGELLARDAVERVAARRADRTDGGVRTVRRRDGNLSFRHHADAIEEIARAERDRSRLLDRGRNGAADGQQQVRRRETKLVWAVRLHQDVSQHGHGALLVRDPLTASQDSEQLLFRDDDVHSGFVLVGYWADR
ncbi:MAG: hypothetical protein BWY99_02721 [Synergistetes bacterium ADurb.BinA166]|nr:MAG: hypothetical protein BWY99_02721 [Synergistetes bacterium ADurb.BinA166]